MRDDFRLAIRGAPTYSRGEPVSFTFELENVGDRDYRLLVWNTPLEGEVFNFLEVRYGDDVVPYDGRMVSRTDPDADSYRTLRVGETIVEELDISMSYALAEPGGYEVTLLVRFADVIPAVGTEVITARPRHEHQGLTLGPVSTSFELLPDGPPRSTAGERARSEQPRDGARRIVIDPDTERPSALLRDFPLPPGFAEVFAAHDNACAWLDASIAELDSWSGRTDNTLYREWFGADSVSRHKTVRDRMAGTRAWMNRRITYDLSPPSCGANTTNYTHLGSDTVYVCPAFYGMPATGTDSRFGAIVHEWSHAATNVDTDDIVYGLPASRTLAISNPDKAAKNADNYSSFVETLSLRMLTAPVFWPNGKVYVFAGGQYYRIDPGTRRVDPGYPLPINPNWPGLWSDRVDAGVVWPNGKAYFFRDGQYMRYDIATDKVDAGYPLPTGQYWPGLWGDRVDAGIVWNNGKAYFFRDDQYMRYDIAADKVDPGYPKPIAGNWPGLWGDGIQGAVMWNDGKAYLMRGWQYVGYDVTADRVAPAYPRAIGENWPGLWSGGGIDAAIMYNNGNAYFMRGTLYRGYDIAEDRVIDPAYVLTIAGNWPGLWDTVDSGIPWPNGKVYFFRGPQYMRWDIAANRVDPGYPKPIAGNWPGLWSDRIDAAVLWPNGKAYFFRGDQYMRYDVAADRVDPGYPLPVNPYWPGLWGDGVDAGIVWNNGKAYFFKGSQYMRYDIAADRVDDGYPLPIGSNWPGLPGRTG
ncbi:hemopexin repeat-containing protein [Streptomyces erythrochromogenes]|uniref:Hemopexin repeat-containing protein n=1 Tax=Streptomyces erythrochromogenes TaxID=285574 RepID=A0ABZ1QG73_9ACTN|nr:hemopexin repeat-containing protein [Streptomyces erythrochromogenes]